MAVATAGKKVGKSETSLVAETDLSTVAWTEVERVAKLVCEKAIQMEN